MQSSLSWEEVGLKSTLLMVQSLPFPDFLLWCLTGSDCHSVPSHGDLGPGPWSLVVIQDIDATSSQNM